MDFVVRLALVIRQGRTQGRDAHEQILKEGLASADIENRAHILERLQLLYEETGKDREAESVRQEIKQAREPTATTVRFAPDSMQVKQSCDFGDKGLPLEDVPNRAQSLQPIRSADGGSFEGKHRVGRNDACPCGSGRKFKKCFALKPQ